MTLSREGKLKKSIRSYCLWSPLLLAVLTACPATAFDLPRYDPWYYQSDEQGYSFMVPDKVQHFYGSALINEVNKRLPLPGIEVLGPALSITAGIMWEVYQDQGGVGFSRRDLVADAMGVAASQLSSRNVIFWLDYSTQEQVIMVNVSLMLPH